MSRAQATAVYRARAGTAQTLVAGTGAAVASSAVSPGTRVIIMWGEVAFRYEVSSATDGTVVATSTSPAHPANVPIAHLCMDGEQVSVLGLAAGNVHMYEASF